MRRNDISSPEFRAKFESTLDKNGPLHPHRPELGRCWNWTGCRNSDGYGNVTVGLKSLGTHRVAWTLWCSRLTSEHVLHSCDNRACANPEHLFLGTHKDNMRDCAVKRRLPRGGLRNSQAKLSPEQVIEIRYLYCAAGMRQTELAALFGISQSQVSNVVRGVHWSLQPSAISPPLQPPDPK